MAYYFDAINGLDTNSGTDPDHAWQTITPAASVPQGSVLLFKNGCTFPGQLAVIEGCSYGSYWLGDKPIIGSGAQFGIVNQTIKGGSVVQNNLTFDGLHFNGSSDRLMEMIGASNITINNCEWSNVGSTPIGPAANVNGFYGQFCTNVKITKCYFHDITGDNIYSEAMAGFKIDSNKFDTPQGPAADGIQVGATKVGNRSSDITITNNIVNMRTLSTNSGKGGIIVQDVFANGTLLVNGVAKAAWIDSNIVVGLNYGIAVSGDDVLVTNNSVSQATQNSYSWGIGVGDSFVCNRHEYTNNNISNCNRGIVLTADAVGPINRVDFNIHDNTILNCGQAYYQDQPGSGIVDNNTILNSQVKIQRVSQGLIVATGGTYTTMTITPNVAFDFAPTSVIKTNL
jgi:hypothetical protein